jgi:hypothetical protein
VCGYTALVRCVLVLRCGSAGVCGILMQAEALVPQPVLMVCWIVLIVVLDCFNGCVGLF